MGAVIDINTDGIAKLAEIVSFALGGAARGERKMADAKAYAAEVEAKTKNKVALIEAQGEEELARFIEAKETRKLNNTMAVIGKARSYFSDGETVSDEPVDEGWINRFFGIIEDISDEELRDIWGRVLAGEIKKPKSYSLRTLETLRNLTSDEASIIVKAATNTFFNEYVYKNASLSLQEKLLLQEIGVMLDDGMGLEFNWEVKAKSVFIILLDNNYVLTLHNDSEKTIKCNTEVYKLSTAGKEIIKMVTVKADERESFYKILANHFRTKGISRIYKHKITCINPEIRYMANGEEI